MEKSKRKWSRLNRSQTGLDGKIIIPKIRDFLTFKVNSNDVVFFEINT